MLSRPTSQTLQLVALMGGVFAIALLAGAPSARASDDLAGHAEIKLIRSGDRDRTPSRFAPLGTATATSDPETIWVGHWSGANTADNWWKVGGVAGGNRPGVNDDGLWNFEPAQQVHGDSLSGWWSVRVQHTNSSGSTLTDENRPWWAVSYGNSVNFAFNPGSGSSRTYGVTGMWHRDAGSAATQVFKPGLGGAPPLNPYWSPLGGSYSAWMGMRSFGDVTYVDPVTNNAYNADTQVFLYGSSYGAGQLPSYFPGYIGDMDQMLYRNVDLSAYAGGGITVRFKWRTDMSTGKDTDPRYRTGWHEGDELSQNQYTPGNFISAEAGGNALAPIDSLQLYIGAPVEGEWKTSIHPMDDDPMLISAGVIDPATGRRVVQDPLRRWFNEVVEKDARLWLFGASGFNAVQTTTIAISDASVQALLDSAAATGQAGKLRLVFRVHTNRSFDDAASYASNYAGAAVIDDVEIDAGGGFTTIGDFESPGSIDNLASADDAWHSTGKPPATYFHPHDVATLVYEDICGPVGSSDRKCNLSGVVGSMGLHDMNEAMSDPETQSTEHEGYWGFMSPTINLAGADQNSKDPAKNNMNLTASERFATDDYYFYLEFYTGALDVFTTGQMIYIAAQAYPMQQVPGDEGWGRIRYPGFMIFDPNKECVSDIEPLFANGLGATSNPNGIPDSLRWGVIKLSQCYRFGVTTGCASTDGLYFDQMAIGIVDDLPRLISADPWDLFNDTFPANETPGLPGTAAFDTTTALIKIGLNVSDARGDLFRYAVPGDSLTVTAAGDSMRLDLVFRLLPGVGNFQTVGDASSGLRKDPTNPGAGTVTPGDGTFFGSFMASPGAFSGLPGAINAGAAVAAHAAAPSGWNETVWNSARMDTAEIYGHAMFPVQGRNAGLPPTGTIWCSTYHETELAARPTLGIPRNRCFMIDTLLYDINDPNLTCGDPSKGSYPPAWVTTLPASRTGWDGTTSTVEGTKIIPDGLLTPGAHVQYFIRRQDLDQPASAFAMVPDTNQVALQIGEGWDRDGHRWQHFGVLPDRWKDPAFDHGGMGMACMLVYDNADGRGDEQVWKAVADSIGLTGSSRRGVDDGYGGVPSGGDIDDPAYFISGRNGQPGTFFDVYAKKGGPGLTVSAQGIGGRLAYRETGTGMDDGAGTGKWTYNPPTLEMLKTYYRMLVVLTGDVEYYVWGPNPDDSADDVGIMESWLASGNPATPDRGILVIGQSFMEAAADQGGVEQAFVQDYLGTTFQNADYRLSTPDDRKYVDAEPGNSIDLGNGDIYGVDNGCRLTNDVVDVHPGLPGAAVNLAYVQPGGAQSPFGVYKAHDGTNPWISQTIAVRLASMRGRFGTSNGRLAWMFNLLSNTFGPLDCYALTLPVTTDVPGGDRALTDYLSLAGNPVRAADATIRFGLALDDDVEVKIFDVSGRLVRRLAERRFKAGDHTLVWDGTDDAGHRMPRGVYFTRLTQKSGRFEAVKKVTMLR